jgi:putative nucleotidyltransferase with HDIG domain
MGVHETIVDQLEESAITACDKALYLAKDFGRNRVCTTMMTEVERLLDETGKDDNRSPLEKLAGFLDKLADQLGAVQKEHLFDHARLVARTAEHIARLMQVDRRGCQQARIAGLAHDIGKCIVPEQILAKPGPLTLTERSVVALHSEFGGRIAGRLGLGQTIEQAICTHHERYDISRSRIPRRQLDRSVLGRILCASDALVAMTSQRPYADAMDRGAALREMRQQSGLQFDPDVVEAAHFVELRTAA